MALTDALGFLRFLEPCSLGVSLLFLKSIEGNPAAVKVMQAAVFTRPRSLFMGGARRSRSAGWDIVSRRIVERLGQLSTNASLASGAVFVALGTWSIWVGVTVRINGG